MSDERPESLAAQAASWVPPWERAPRSPDREFEARARAGDRDEPDPSDDDDLDPAAEDPSGDDAPAAAAPRGAADGEVPGDGAPDGDALGDAAADGEVPGDGAPDGDAPGDGAPDGDAPGDAAADGEAGDAAVDDRVPAELPPFPEETGGPPTVDAPRELPGDEEREPTDVGAGPELPLPGAIEEAAENEIGNAPTVDAPLDGDDAGDVFDAAADDDVRDDAELDLPFEEVVPGPEEDDEQPTATTAPPEGSGDLDPPADATTAVPQGSGDLDGQAIATTAVPQGSGDLGEQATGDQGSAGSTAADAVARGGADVESAVAAGALASQPVSRARPSSGIPAQGRGSKAGAAAPVALSTRTDEGVSPTLPAPMDDAELRAALEAILLVVDEPVAEMQLAQIVEQPTERVAAVLEDTSARYTAAGHGFDLRRAAGGWRLYTRPEYAAYVERFVLDGQSARLTQAALETLAVVAYKQPVTRSRISAIRGVNCDGVMRTLTTRGLIEECGTEGETGAFLYRTTALFLEKLGLNSVDQLPPLAPFLPDDVEEVLDASG